MDAGRRRAEPEPSPARAAPTRVAAALDASRRAGRRRVHLRRGAVRARSDGRAARRTTFPDDGIVTCDAGENRLFMMHWYRSRSRPGGYLQPAAGGGMGYAVPAALGAKLAHPDAPVLAVCGDGGFAMSIHGLMTAVEQHLPIAVVVFNNSALGWVLHGMGERAVAAGFDEFDHAAIARSVGCDGASGSTASSELRAALAEAATTTEPLVIDVPTSLKTSFKDIVQSLAGDRWKAGE